MADFKLAGIVSAVGFGLGYLLSGRNSQVMEAVQGEYGITYMEAHNDAKNQHKYYLLLTSGKDNYTAYGRLPGYGRDATMKLDKQPSASKMKELAMKKMKTYQLVGHKYDQIPSEIRAKLETAIGVKPSSQPAESKPQKEESKKPMDARLAMAMKRRQMMGAEGTLYTAGKWRRPVKFRHLDDKKYDGAIELQGYGFSPAKLGENLQIGDVLVWNNGYKSRILDIQPKGKQSLVLKTMTQDTRYKKGEEFERTIRKNRLVGVAQDFHKFNGVMIGDLPPVAGQPQPQNARLAMAMKRRKLMGAEGGMSFDEKIKHLASYYGVGGLYIKRNYRKGEKLGEMLDDLGIPRGMVQERRIKDEAIHQNKYKYLGVSDWNSSEKVVKAFIEQLRKEGKIISTRCAICKDQFPPMFLFKKIAPKTGEEITVCKGCKGFFGAEYQPDQEIADYSVSEIAKSSAIEGYQPNKYSFGPIGYGAETFEAPQVTKPFYIAEHEKNYTHVMHPSDCGHYKMMDADKSKWDFWGDYDSIEEMVTEFLGMLANTQADDMPDDVLDEYKNIKTVGDARKWLKNNGVGKLDFGPCFRKLPDWNPKAYNGLPITPDLSYVVEELDAESVSLKKDSCCCGATKKHPCLCMIKGVKQCSAKSPMCPCYKEIAMGTKVEMEHTESKEEAEKIAKEHLAEHPDYYSRLKSAGLDAETFEAKGGKRMYCPNCKTNRTWNSGFKKQNLDYSKGERPRDFIFYVCRKCDYAYDPKTGKEIVGDWRKMFGYDAESSDSIPKPNPADKEETFAWVKREHPHIKTEADKEMDEYNYAALTYHPEELESGAVNALKAGDLEAAQNFVKAINRQKFIKAFQAERNR